MQWLEIVLNVFTTRKVYNVKIASKVIMVMRGYEAVKSKT